MMFRGEKWILGGLPVYVFAEEWDAYTHAIWVTHGRCGQVEDVFDLCERTLRESCQGKRVVVIAIEERNHGARKLDDKLNQSWHMNVHHPRDIYSLLIGMMYDIQSCIEMLGLYIAILDREQFQHAVVGVSLGAHVALLCGTHLKNVHASVSLMGSGDFQDLMNQRFESTLKKFENDPSIFEPDSLAYFQTYTSLLQQKEPSCSSTPPCLSNALKELCLRFDPIHHVDNLKDKHILMISGEHDTLVPPRCHYRLYEKLISARVQAEEEQQQPPKVIYHLEKKAKHHLTHGMILKTLDFIRDWLERTSS